MRKLIFALAFCVSQLLVSRLYALEILAYGTLGPEEEPWEGHFLVGPLQIEGTISLPQLDGILPVEGTLYRDTADGSTMIEMRLSETSPLAAAFIGTVVNKALEGKYTIGSDGGAWRGSWTIADGAPAPRVTFSEETTRLLQAVGDESPAPSFEFDPSDPSSMCRFLDDPRFVSRISGGLAAHLSRRCSTSDRSDSSLVTTIVSAAVNYFWRTVTPAGAQYPPANYRANNPNGPPSADVYPFITQNEVSIAASHVNPDVMVAAYNDTSHIHLGSGVGYARTQNRGVTWIDMGLVSPPDSNHEVTTDPVVAAHPNGVFYIAHIVRRKNPTAYFIGVKRSFDGGQTFGPTANASPTSMLNMQDKPDIAVDRTFASPYYGRVYVCWFDLGAGGIRFSRSLDGGANFTQLDNAISSDVNSNVNGCSIAIGRQGHVWVAWWNRFTAPKSIYIARSTDGGINFGPQVVLAQAPYVVPPPISLENICQAIPFLNGFVGVKFWGNIAADPLVDNNVYAVWQSWDETLQSSEIYFSASTQGGQAATWSAPVRINDVTTGDQFFPRIATNVFHASPPDKTQLKVIWYDRRLDPQNLSVHVFGDTSFNAGAAWQNDVRWSTIASPLPDIKVNFDCNWGGACYFGDYNGLSTMGPGSDLFVAAWGDTRPPLASGTPCNTYPSPQPDPNVMTAVGC